MSLKQTLKLAKQLENQAKKSDDSPDNNTANLSALKDATKPRNHVAFNPLLKKGGVHEKDNIEAVRKKKRRETKKILRQKDWLSEI